jgi:hypothetical protein
MTAQDFVDENAIFTEIGFALLGENFGATRLTKEEAYRAGKNWFASVLPTIRKRICGNPAIEKQLFEPVATARNAALIAVIEGAINGLFTNVPVLSITHAIICYGVKRICQDSQ